MSMGKRLLLGATLIVVGLTALSLTCEGPWWWLIPVLLLILYQALIVWGVMDLELNMFTQSVCRVPTARRVVALTFDDGPDPVSTPLVLAALKTAGVQATFFLIGHKVERYPDVVRQIAADGHTLATHSYRHELLYAFLSADFVQRDIARCQALIEACGTACSRFFRPPVGQASPRTAEGMRRAQVLSIGWSVRGGDGVARRTPRDCERRVLSKIGPGSIVLLHDAWQGRCLPDEAGARPLTLEQQLQLAPAGVRALPRLLTELRARGYECVSLESMLNMI